MSNTKSNVVVHLDDPTASILNQTETNEQRTVEIAYSEHPSEDRLGVIQDKDREISIQYPIEESNDLLHHRHLTVQFRRDARDNTTSTISGSEQRVGFSILVTQLASWGLRAEGTTFSDVSVPSKHATTLVLYDAWQFGSIPQLVKLLTDFEDLAADIGYDAVPHRSTVWRAANALRESGDRDAVRAAAKRVVHAIARNGGPLPATVRDRHGLDISPTLDEREIAEATRQRAIKNWIQSILPRVLEPLTFHREATKYSVESIVATLAQAAFASGTAAGPRTAVWHYPEEEVPTMSQITDLVNDLGYTEIFQLFTEINIEFIRLVSELGFFATPADMSIDTTWLPLTGEANPDESANKLIGNPKNCDSGQGWCITALGVANSQCRFVVGADLATRKTEYADRYRYLLKQAGQEINIGRIYADREFESGDMVEMCRAIAGDEWVIRHRKKNEKGDIAEIIGDVDNGEMLFAPKVSFAGVTPDPNLYIHPIPKDKRRNNGNTHMYFLTDLGEAGSWPTDVYAIYMKRWNIETSFRQIKHRFYPTSQSSSGDFRFFLFNIATLYYNIHTLINRAPSPRYGLRLDAKFDEVLLGLVDSILSGAAKSTNSA